ncbi:MAG: PIG-L family deacetylase [Actinomycetota bacterium]|nr:PIG-L family deacetylase [Actinomycetota bacterium]
MSSDFMHDGVGTDEQHWAHSTLTSADALPCPGAGDRVVVVAAHPDDESLGAGGLIADALRRGAEVHVVIATDGQASHPRSPTHTPLGLARRRREEVRAAIRSLSRPAKAATSATGEHCGVGVEFLGLPDGDLAAHVDVLASQIAQRLVGATHVVSPWRGDRHPDHEASAAAAAEAAADAPGCVHWQYPIWAWHWSAPDQDDLPWPDLRRLQLTPPAVEDKRAALACHRSQHTALSDAVGDEAILSPQMLAHFARDYETFVVEAVSAASRSSYFDALYDAQPDPWGLGTRYYETRKRAILLASLPRRRFARAFEPGCATGELTGELAQRCDELVAWDAAAAAAHLTRSRVGRPGVLVERRRIPVDWPEGTFDLIVLSEVGYYCADLAMLADRVAASMAPDAVLVACHWLHRAGDHPHAGGAVHDALGRGMHTIAHHREADFVLDVWSRTGSSVAAREGIVDDRDLR